MAKQTRGNKKEAGNNSKKFFGFRTPESKTHSIIAIISAALILLVGIVAIGFAVFDHLYYSEITSSKIMKSFVSKFGDKNTITDLENYTEETDPNGTMGTENSYTSKSSWNDSRLNEKDEEFAGTLEVFRNEKDAQLREWKLNLTKEECPKRIKVGVYGEDFAKQICNGLSYGTIYRDGAVVIRLSGAFSDEQVDEYRMYFNKIIDYFDVPNKDVPSDEKIEELKAEISETLDSIFNTEIDEIEARLNDMASEFDQNVEKVKTSKDEEDLADIKDELEYYKTIPYFAKNVAKWEKAINKTSDAISKEKAEAARKAEEEKRAELAAKTRTFSAGKYVAGKDIDTGTFNIIAVSGSGNCFIYTASGSLTVNEMMSPSDPRFYISRYNNAYLGSGYEIEITSSLNLRFEAVE